MNIWLKRDQYDEFQTIGTLEIYDRDSMIYSCRTLERPWINNEPNRSCIPVGTYVVVPRISRKFKAHLHVLDVPDRDWVLIHAGNFVSDTTGCILVGRDFLDIDGDGHLDLTNSRECLGCLVHLIDSPTAMTITRLH